MTTTQHRPTGVRYIELGARDLQRSRDFYGGLLGLDEVDAPTPGEAVQRGPDAWFAAGPSLLRVVEVGSDGEFGDWRDDDLQAGVRHVGFKVPDVDAAVRRLERAGTPVLVQPLDALGAVRIAFFLDPDGARLEYVQGALAYQLVASPAAVAAERANLPTDGDRPRFDHVGLTVPDLDAALAYWCGTHHYEVVGHIRHHDDARGFLMTYLTAGGAVLELFSFDVATSPAPTTGPDRLGLRGFEVTDRG